MIKLNTIIILICSLFLTSCGGEQETDNAQLETDISPVIPKINSTVTQILVDDNQAVKEGDTLVLLDNANYQIAVKQAEIAVAIAKQNVQVAKSGKGIITTNVSSVTANSNAVAANLYPANAAVEAAKVRLDAVMKNYQRFKILLEQKAATQQQFDAIEAEKEAAEKQIQIAEAQVVALQKQVDAAKSQITSTQANLSTNTEGVSLAELTVKQAEANLESAKLMLSYCAITAPASGVISKKNVQKGQVVAVGQPLMAITNNQNIWIVANFKETQIEKMQVGQAAEIKVDAYSDKTFEGSIASFSQATGAKFSLLPPDNATGNFVKVTQRIPVKIAIKDAKDPNFPLRAGMSVSVKIKSK
jgi:membrane fusion protein, multidrug efflux system